MALPLLLANILGGIGQGVGGAGQAIARERESALDRQRQTARDALLERQVRLSEEQYANERNDREVLATEAANNPELAPYAPLLRNKGGADVVKWLAELGAKQKAQAAEIADRNKAADVITNAAGAPGRPTSALQLGEDPEAGAFIGSTGFKAPMSMNDVRAALARTKVGPALFKEMYPQDKFGGVPLDQDLTNLGTGEVVRPGTPKPTEPKQLNAPAAMESAIRRFQALRDDPQFGPEHPATKNAYEIVLGLSQVSGVPEGGFAVNRGSFLSLTPHGTPKPTAPQASNAPSKTSPGVIAGPPKPPDAGERKNIAELNALIPLGKKLLAQWDANPTIKPSAARQLGEREIAMGMKASDLIGATTTDEQKTFMAESGQIVGDYRRIQSGLNVTGSEALRSMPTVPDDPAALTKQQLKSLVEWTERNRAEIDRALVEANRRPGPAPQATPAAPAPTKPAINATSGWTIKRVK